MHRMKSARWVPLIRFLYRRIGQWRAEHLMMGLAKRVEPLHAAPVQMVDGRVLYLDLRNPASMPYLLTGDFDCERFETEFVRQVVRPGDTVIDVGANVGWYASLLCELVGPEGRVYAFEPNSRLAALLDKLDMPQLRAVAAGLGDCDGEQCFSIPENWISGSFGEVADAVATECVPMVRLDAFLETEKVDQVTFVKCDAEGAELGILSGASDTLHNARPPMWLVEMSSEETAKFGYHPTRLVEFFEHGTKTEYKAFMVNQQSGNLEPLQVPAEEPFWFNAVFVPSWLEHRISPSICRPTSSTTPQPMQQQQVRP